VDRIKQTFFSRYYRWDIEVGESCAPSARAELERRLPEISPSSWEARFELGGVYVAGTVASLDTQLHPPCRLEYYAPVTPLDQLSESYPRFDPGMIIYKDEDLGVAWKPAGLPTTAPRDQRVYNFQRYLSDHFGVRVHLPSRLDVAVAGLVLFSLSPRMNRHLQKAYDRKLIQKHYLAEVAGMQEGGYQLNSNIARDPKHSVLRRVVSEGGVPARTVVHGVTRYIRETSPYSLLHVELMTGRTHQIRVHLAGNGSPIVGDPYYGGEEAPEVRLVSYALRLYHPYKSTSMSIELPESVWPRWLSDVKRMAGRIEFSYREDKTP
jgi:23S rRNA-/tRNA-specific pseudouridylate synthase